MFPWNYCVLDFFSICYWICLQVTFCFRISLEPCSLILIWKSCDIQNLLLFFLILPEIQTLFPSFNLIRLNCIRYYDISMLIKVIQQKLLTHLVIAHSYCLHTWSLLTVIAYTLGHCSLLLLTHLVIAHSYCLHTWSLLTLIAYTLGHCSLLLLTHLIIAHSYCLHTWSMLTLIAYLTISYSITYT